MIAKKLAYMPKARIRAREEKTEVPESLSNDTESKFVNYTLDEEQELSKAQGLPSNDRETESNSTAHKLMAESVPAASAMSKSASGMWLQARMKADNRISASYGDSTPTARTALQQIKQISKSDTRYLTKTSLPYALPPKIAEAKSTHLQEVALGNVDTDAFKMRENIKADEFNSFMRSTHFAAKQNRLVRQCIHCQLLYSTSHTCVGLGSSLGQDSK